MTTPSTGDFEANLGEKRRDTRDPQGDPSWQTRSVVNGTDTPRMPHERDESSDSGAGPDHNVMQIAHDDAESEKAPTDKGEATDATYARSLRSPTPGAERDVGGPEGG